MVDKNILRFYSTLVNRGKFLQLLLLSCPFHSLNLKAELNKGNNSLYSSISWSDSFDNLFHSHLIDDVYNRFRVLKESFASNMTHVQSKIFTDLAQDDSRFDLIELVHIDFVIDYMSNTAISLGTHNHALFGRILESLSNKFSVLLPILAIPLSRFYTETCQFQKLISLRNRIHSQESVESLECIDGFRLFYQFGHQLVYPYQAYVANEEWNCNYYIAYDPDLANNPFISKIQVLAGFPLRPISLNQSIDPRYFRTWSPTISIHSPRVASICLSSGLISHDYLTAFLSKLKDSQPPNINQIALMANYSPKCSILQKSNSARKSILPFSGVQIVTRVRQPILTLTGIASI